MVLCRSSQNPIITRTDVPDIPPFIVDATSVFNPGAIKIEDRYLLMLRVQTRGRRTYLVMAESDDGVDFAVSSDLVELAGIERCKKVLYHVYDPRLTRIDDRYYVMFAADTDGGCKLGVAETADFIEFEFLGFGDDDDIRNGVLFPEKFDGKFLRLDRPNVQAEQGGPTSGDEIWLSASIDLVMWHKLKPVFKGRPHYWDERIGSGPPPVKTREGWLHIYHGVATHFGSSNIYQAGVVLLDLKDPTKLIARGEDNVLEPRELYELTGQVPNVVFPSGMVVESYDKDGFAQMDSEVLVYYGAADTCVGLATTTIQQLLAACR